MTSVESYVSHWADRIRPHLEQAVENIVAAGRGLIEAKDALPHGSFGPLLDELGLSIEMATRFMRVAAHPVLSNLSPATGLPPHVTVLDVLARLEAPELERAIEAGFVTPSTTRDDARRLVDAIHGDREAERLATLHIAAYIESCAEAVVRVLRCLWWEPQAERLDDLCESLGYPPHDMLRLIPPMRISERQGLTESIRRHGVIRPVMMHQGVLLDGRERIRACHELGIDVPIMEYAASEPDLWPLKENVAFRPNRETPGQHWDRVNEAYRLMVLASKAVAS